MQSFNISDLNFLFQVFCQFGTVLDVELVDEAECAYITFQDFFQAWYA